MANLDIRYDPICKACHHFEAIHAFGRCAGTVQRDDNSMTTCDCKGKHRE